MSDPARFLTRWEREDYERSKRGEPELGPFGASEAMTASLFDALPEFPPALPDDELRMLAALPHWPATQELDCGDWPAARRLERRGLIKIERHKTDPIAISPTWFAGKLRPPAALLPNPPHGRVEGK